MARLPCFVILASTLAASVPAGAAAGAWGPGAHYVPTHRFASPAHVAPAYPRPSYAAAYRMIAVRPVYATYRTYAYAPPPVYTATRVASVPVPYYVAVPAYGGGLAYSAPQSWGWSPVGSVVPLAGRGELRYYCPDFRVFYPQVESCPTPWLKVLP